MRRPVGCSHGGVGKSLAARALVQCYLKQPADHRPRLVVFDGRIAPVADELREPCQAGRRAVTEGRK